MPVGTYEYDAMYRLIKAEGRELAQLDMPTHEDFINTIGCPADNAMQNYIHHYKYDELGNILQMRSQNQWTREYDYDVLMPNNYLLGHGDGTVYTYDAHGNMTSMPHLQAMSYDYLDQLNEVTLDASGNKAYYNYDTQGNRTRKVIVKGNIREERYYINGYEVYRKYNNNVLDFERRTINISDDEKVFVRIETKTGENAVIRYQYDNHLGSACLELDDTGQIISYEEYHPFGTTSYRSGRGETEVSLKRYKYCGKERDEETGLYYYGMRYYAAWLCRFISVDPLQFKYPYYTPFQYAGNKPISYIDLDGGEEFKEDKNTVENKRNPTGEIIDQNLLEINDSDINNILEISEVSEKIKENVVSDAVLLEVLAGLKQREQLPEGNFKEHGGIIGYTKEGELRIVWAKSGKAADPSKDKEARINVFIPENEDEKDLIVDVIATFHSHPSGSVRVNKPIDLMALNVIKSSEEYDIHKFEQSVSKQDINVAKKTENVRGDSYVFAMGDKVLYQYNKNSNIKTTKSRSFSSLQKE